MQNKLVQVEIERIQVSGFSKLVTKELVRVTVRPWDIFQTFQSPLSIRCVRLVYDSLSHCPSSIIREHGCRTLSKQPLQVSDSFFLLPRAFISSSKDLWDCCPRAEYFHLFEV